MPKSKISPKKLLEMINKVRARVKNTEEVKNIFKEYKIDLDEIDYVPMCFKDLDVSARTEHGCIYFSYDLIEDGDFEDDDHYMVHELTHWAQQTSGTKPTSGSTDDSYLDNPNEEEGFQYQAQFIENTRGEEAAKDYVNKLLDHHDLKGKERKDKKEEILERKAKLTYLNGL
jgi:hypothetical protein